MEAIERARLILDALTLATAVAAGIFAWRAAHWTKQQALSASEQAASAKRQVRAANREVRIARQALRAAKVESAAVARRQKEERIDAAMPSVSIRARSAPELVTHIDGDPPSRSPIPGSGCREPEGSTARFELGLICHVQNPSDRIATVFVSGRDVWHLRTRDGHEVAQGRGIYLDPGESCTLTWSRTVPFNLAREFADRGEDILDLRFSVWDAGHNAYDVVLLRTDLRVFERDGSMLRVARRPAIPWRVSHGEQLPDRIYDRLGDKAPDALTRA